MEVLLSCHQVGGGGANVHVMDSVISVPVGKKLDYKSLTVSDIED